MDIVRNDDGTLIVPVEAPRAHPSDDDQVTEGTGGGAPGAEAAPESGEPSTRVLHPGEGGYDEALAEWDLQQDPDRGPAVSTASGREQAMAVVHAVGSEEEQVADAVEGASAEPVAEALRHVLVGGQPSVEAFAAEVAEAEGGEPLPAHEVTKVISEVLGEVDG